MINRREFLVATAASAAALSTRRAHAFAPLSPAGVCPKSAPPARKLAVFDLQELTSYPQDFRLTLHCLQGIVNRRQPRLYLVQDHYDELWLDWLRERGDIDAVERLEIGHLLERFLPEVSSMYITDPSIPASVNVASMLAGLDSALVATPAIADQFKLSAGNFPDDSKVGYDLRRLHWKKNVDAYRWFFSHHEKRMSRSAVAMLDPSTSAIRDYFVSFNIPTVWISSVEDAARNPQADHDAEIEFVRELFLRWPANIPCLGWPGNGVGSEEGIGEWDGVLVASEAAKFQSCSAYDGYSPTVSNLTIHSGTTATFHQHAEPVTLKKDKVYFAMIRSDGDGPNFLRHYYRKLFDDPDHGAVPLGWHIGPTATDIMPDILDYYYKHARPGDCFVNALTGVGYIHEDSYADRYSEAERPAILKEYLEISERYRDRLDASTLSTFEEMDPERLELMTSMPGIRGVFANYGRTHVTNASNLLTTVKGKPVFRSVNSLLGNRTFTLEGRREAVDEVVRTIRANTPASPPFFFHVFLGNWLITMDMAKEIVQQLGPKYVAVRPDQLVSLFEQSKA
jgi:GxGYxYP putative glycoside hydrolase C-terminal domain/GxGYxY sequence motif in domain of unknown function N-terminal